MPLAIASQDDDIGIIRRKHRSLLKALDWIRTRSLETPHRHEDIAKERPISLYILYA